MKTVDLILAVALALAASRSTKASSCSGVGFGYGGPPFVTVGENAPHVRVWLSSSGDTNQLRTLDYFTTDGLPEDAFLGGVAKAGVDYEPRKGIATFLVGQTTTSVEVPLIDNGLRDGAKVFRLVLGNSPAAADGVFLVRMEDNEVGGAVDPLFTSLQRSGLGEAPRFSTGKIPNFSWHAGTQPDGRLLVVTTNATRATTLRRFHADGTADGSFQPLTRLAAIEQVGLLASGEVLILGREVFSQSETALLRLNTSAEPDSTFAPSKDLKTINRFFPRRDGKIIVFDLTANTASQLNEDGTVDDGFPVITPIPGGWLDTLLEQPDGHLLAADSRLLYYSDGVEGVVTRWSKEGILEEDLTLVYGFRACWPGGGLDIAPAGEGFVLISGSFTQVDGFPRNGRARLFTNPPERDFRMMTPAEFTRASGVARLRVVRTGGTTHAASVTYATRDDTAKAGEDYVPRSGKLHFAPLEVSQEVEVLLLAGPALANPRSFLLELNDPSAGYAAIAASPVVIAPELRVVIESVTSANGAMDLSVTVHGTVPGNAYSLESSSDFRDWQVDGGILAVGSTVRFGPRSPSISGAWRFFRAVKQ